MARKHAANDLEYFLTTLLAIRDVHNHLSAISGQLRQNAPAAAGRHLVKLVDDDHWKDLRVLIRSLEEIKRERAGSNSSEH